MSSKIRYSFAENPCIFVIMTSFQPGQEHIKNVSGGSDCTVDSLADFVRESRRLIGVPVTERVQWNTEASADAIRHFAWAISDDNPLWVDSDYAAVGRYGRLAAPPTFLFSVLYPFLHGVAPSFPLTFLISDIDCRWHLPILEGDKLTANAVHKEVIEVPDRAGRNTIHIVAETTYRNHSDEVVGTIEGTMAAIERPESEMMLDREIFEYQPEDLEAIGAALRAEKRTGRESAPHLGVQPGDELPAIVRGPLTLGDLINWQAAVGPSYRAGALAYRDLLEKPHTATVLPRVGWPVRYSQQHEDFTLTRQRGMPAPFDNSSMRAAWISVILTNWIGDSGDLRRLRISTVRPVIYGDTNWYSGKVLRLIHGDDEVVLAIRLTGTNQLGEITTTGEAEVVLPRRPGPSNGETRGTRGSAEIHWGRRDLVSSPVTVCDLFAQQVQARPDAIAIVGGDQTLTYAALDAKATAMSEALAARGIKSGSRLGLYLGREVETAVAFLACAKAEIAYVPLDPSYPDNQLRQMVDDASLDALVTEGGQIFTNGDGYPEHLLLNSLTSARPDEVSQRTAKPPSVEASAYVLFTSGSTGRRKAVAIDHGALGVYLSSIIDTLDVTDSDVYMHTASFSFSASVRQFWLPLCVGAKLIVVDEEVRHKPLTLFEMMLREGATVWDTVPSILNFAIESLWELSHERREALLENRLRWIFTTGEPLSWDTVRAWKQLPRSHATIVNLYSQTEVGGTVCVYPNPQYDAGRKGFVPLGRPIAHTGLCLLDDHSKSVDNGEVGEICVTGERLGSRYRNEPAGFERLATPGGGETWVFRTGDLGRLNHNGVLEFVGRTDDQIKIRGLRVQLGELEAAVSRDPGVADCAVIAMAEGNVAADNSLIAYVVPCDGMQIDVDELRSRVARWLPGFMVPRAIVLIDALPRTSNGKLDRSALPVPAEKATDKRSKPVAPRNATEEMLCSIWRELLSLEDVGIHDNFFELGGHSLLATRVITHVNDKTKVELSVSFFFDHPTISELAMQVERQKEERSSGCQLGTDDFAGDTIRKLPRDLESLPLSSAQSRIWFMERLNNAESAVFNIPRLVFFDGTLRTQLLADSINLIVSRHTILRARFSVDSGIPVQRIEDSCVIALPLVDLSGLDPDCREAELRRQVREYGAVPFDLATGPLLRCRLFRMQDNRHVLLFVLHHIVSDGWSTGIFMRELSTAYGAFASGQSPDLPELPIQYPDFSAWQGTWLASPAAERQLSYWLHQMEGHAPAINLPTDYPRPAIQCMNGAQEPVHIEARLVAAMEEVCRKEGATLFMGMLAAFNVLLHRMSGQQDLLVGTPIAGRRHTSTERLIGLFVNTLPVRTIVERNRSFRELLAVVRKVTLELFANQDLPFEVLVRELKISRDLSRSPLFQVAFAMQNLPRAPHIEGISLTLPKLDTGTSKYDLMLQLFPLDAGSLTGFVEYSTALFGQATVRRLITDYEGLLQQLTDHPGRPIERLPT